MGEQTQQNQHNIRHSPSFERIQLGRTWCETLMFNDGRGLIVRPIEPSDADALRRSFGLLTSEEIRYRFLHPITELTPAYAHQLATLDYERQFALVAVEIEAPDQALIGAVVRAAIDDSGSKAEFAIIVGRELGGRGLGSYLMRRMIEWCRKKKLTQVYGDVMLENHRMLRLADRLGFNLTNLDLYPSLVRVYLNLSE